MNKKPCPATVAEERVSALWERLQQQLWNWLTGVFKDALLGKFFRKGQKGNSRIYAKEKLTRVE